jgi:hypothetical protein
MAPIFKIELSFKGECVETKTKDKKQISRIKSNYTIIKLLLLLTISLYCSNCTYPFWNSIS